MENEAKELETLRQNLKILTDAMVWIRDKEPKPCYEQSTIDTHHMYKRKAKKTLNQLR